MNLKNEMPDTAIGRGFMLRKVAQEESQRGRCSAPGCFSHSSDVDINSNHYAIGEAVCKGAAEDQEQKRNKAKFCKESFPYSPEAVVASYNKEKKSPIRDRQTADECEFCNRSPQMVICSSCGFTCRGRVRRRCDTHPEIIHLMDSDCCAQCSSTQLQEIYDKS